MAQYQSDLRDFYFNLFEYLKIQDDSAEYGESELKDIIREFDKFVAKEIFPTRQEGDLVGVIQKEEKVIVPESFKTVLNSFYENGWFALDQPEDIGGMPAPEAIYVACQSLSIGANVALMMYPGLTKAGLNLIYKVGTAEQKETYCAKIMEGTWGGTMCLTEAGAGSDVGAVKTLAEPKENGKYKITGVKTFISSGDSDIYENIVHLVLDKSVCFSTCDLHIQQ